MKTFNVFGNYGELTVDAESGIVLAYKPDDSDDPQYHDIRFFNVAEWRRAYPGEELAGMNMDILDIGFTDSQFAYYPPEEDWREELRRAHDPFYDWQGRASYQLKKRFAINFDDAGIDETQARAYFETWRDDPQGFVAWYGEKYDLIEFA